ncbi:H-NS histone family protein [Azoarcus communis]|uniref:H-NS histone family protein n=1 Tax=Parazoarcus communis SWub3 = DSM 12120 TaxID=1121029 RepID=A0A323V3Z4_9RHOO|nr:H-NS histone family protein [Parazoarcus communis]NMG49874.1 H-NS histone family protein [Parazoarcus communis]NMG71957.1 H-NS histone family protein [Parazoarcus communis SWub3 = DSM 12120]PZA18156.1 H-NS histone family protein [Azoarcus communis] [Parazoarcus communis SWub3 = DSM 12120]
MDLGSMSLTELRRLQSKVESEIRRRSDTARRDLIKRMQKMAAEQGLSLEDVIGTAPAAAEKTPSRRGRKPGKAAKAAKPATVSVIKYRNPANPEQGWTGRGRKPQWALDLLAQGKSLDEAAVQI